MIEGVVVKKLIKNTDERGWLSEIFRKDEDGYLPAMSYISLTNPGIIRGPHEHEKQTDMFVFLGPGAFELHLWDRRENSLTAGQYEKICAGADNPSAITVPPGVVHGYKCVSKDCGLSINFPDKLYKGEGKTEEVDEIRWEKDEKSPYVIA